MDEDFESELYEQDPPEWLERSDDYNVWEEHQLDLDRDAGEYDDPEPEAVAAETEVWEAIMGALRHREYDVEPPVWSWVADDVMEAVRPFLASK